MTNSVTENKIMILWFTFAFFFFTLFLFPSVTPIQICTFLSDMQSIRGYIVFAFFLFMNVFLLDVTPCELCHEKTFLLRSSMRLEIRCGYIAQNG